MQAGVVTDFYWKEKKWVKVWHLMMIQLCRCRIISRQTGWISIYKVLRLKKKKKKQNVVMRPFKGKLLHKRIVFDFLIAVLQFDSPPPPRAGSVWSATKKFSDHLYRFFLKMRPGLHRVYRARDKTRDDWSFSSHKCGGSDLIFSR